MSEKVGPENKNYIIFKNLDNKLKIMSDHPLFFLFIIGIVGFLIRVYYFPYGIPITQDGLGYFWYAIDITILGTFPKNYDFPNTGWPSFLSIFFYLVQSNNFMDYMAIQRLVTIVISVLTIIPIYFLCNRFFNKTYSLLGSALFSFEPRIIQNSLLGLDTPLFVLGTTISLLLFFSENRKYIYASFAILGLSSLVRFEGLILIIPFSIIFFVRFKEKRIVFRYFLSLCIFILVLLPMAYLRMETSGSDGLITNISAGPRYYQKISEASDDSQSEIFKFINTGIVNLVKYFIWILIPIFIFFVPFSLFKIFKNSNYREKTIIFFGLTMLVPAFYAYSRGIQEIKYLLILIPILCILSLYTIKNIEKIINKQNLVVTLLIVGVLISSLIFLYFKIDNYEHEREAFSIMLYIAKTTKITNGIYPEGQYLPIAKVTTVENFPVLRHSFPKKVNDIRAGAFNSLEEFLEYGRTQGLDHLVLDGVDDSHTPKFLNDIFSNEKNYPYLIKEFDSSEHGYKYHVKIFKIDYDAYDQERIIRN